MSTLPLSTWSITSVIGKKECRYRYLFGDRLNYPLVIRKYSLSACFMLHISSVVSLLLCCQAKSTCRESTTNCCRSFWPDKNECKSVHTDSDGNVVNINMEMWKQIFTLKLYSFYSYVCLRHSNLIRD